MGTFLENKVFSKSKFSKIIFLKVGLIVQYFLERLDQFLTQKNDFESQNFEEVVHNFDKSDDDMI